MGKIWKIYGEQPKSAENPEAILNKYARRVSEDTNKEFAGVVTETIKEDSGAVTYALYIIVPQLRDYMYRLIEVNLQNLIHPYPLEITLFAKDPRNHRTYTCDSANEFEKKLIELIKSPVTSGILMHLKSMVEISGKLREGQAGIATLSTGDRINFGVQRIEGDTVLYFTGKGLREMWKPNMTSIERQKAEKLKKLPVDKLIEDGYMDRKKISDFDNIE